MTEDQEKWIEFQKMIVTVKPEFEANFVPKQKFRKILFYISKNTVFESFIMFCIVCNTVTMMIVYEGSSDSLSVYLEDINYFFTIVFIIELLLKLVSLGFSGFFISTWNQFDFFVVGASIIDLLFTMLQSTKIPFLRIGP